MAEHDGESLRVAAALLTIVALATIGGAIFIALDPAALPSGTTPRAAPPEVEPPPALAAAPAAPVASARRVRSLPDGGVAVLPAATGPRLAAAEPDAGVGADAGIAPAPAGSATLAGYVHDTFQRPVIGASLRITRQDGTTYSQVAVVPSDREGRFSQAVPDGKLVVEVSATGFQTRVFEGIQLAAGETRELDVSLAPGERVQGRVVDDAGEPVAGAEVTAVPSRVDAAGDVLTQSDPEGRFSFSELGPGAYCLHAAKPPFVDAEECGVRTGANVTLRLLRPGAVSGRVIRALGFTPVPRFSVTVRASGREEDDVAPSRMRDISSANGEFRVDGLSPGLYVVSITAGRLFAERDRVEVRAGETTGPLAFELAAGGRISGTVVSAADGAPVPGAAVELVLGEVGVSRVVKAKTDEAGRFEFDNVTEGNHRVNVEHAAFQPLLLHGLAREESRGAPFTIRLRPRAKK